MADYDGVIPVDAWPLLDDTYEGIYPKGARDKRAYFAPDRPDLAFLKPKHRYLFKESRKGFPWQFWMELIAYRLGKIVDVAVPPAYVGTSAHSEQDHEGPVFGALIEWFYGPNRVYIDGGAFMNVMIENFDSSRGTQHNLDTILHMPSRFSRDPEGKSVLVKHFAGILCLDSLIGNTDRHQDNWGIIVLISPDKSSHSPHLLESQPSPAFDNGTALGYEILEENFHKFDDEAYLLRYLTRPAKARHHMRWSMAETNPMNFFDFMRRYVDTYPEIREDVERRLVFTQADLEQRLAGLLTIPTSTRYTLTEARLAFTIRLVMKRKELLEKALCRP